LHAQEFGTDQLTVGDGIKSIVVLAPAIECFPPRSVPALPGSCGIGEPGEQVIDGIIADERIEIVAI
jgi:hypothetical protein